MTHAPAARKRPANEDDDGDSEADSSTVPPPDGGWGWVVVWASFMIHIVSEYPSAYASSRLLRLLRLQRALPFPLGGFLTSQGARPGIFPLPALILFVSTQPDW